MSIANPSSAAWRQRVLAERAARLAERPSLQADVEQRRVCLCEAGDDLYGLPVDQVALVAPYTQAAPLANADAALLGIVSRGGGFALIYDLAALVSGSPSDRSAGGHLVLMRETRPIVGFKVTRTVAVADINLLTAEETVNLPTHTGVTAHGRYTDDRIVSIIDIDALLNLGARQQAGG